MDNSPYTTPDAQLSADPYRTYEPKIFALNGRIGRLRYLAYLFGTTVVTLLVLSPLITLLVTALGEDTGGLVAGVLVGLIQLISAVLAIIFGKRRLNDLNRRGWWMVLIIVPVVNIVLSIYLMFFAGTDGENDFGPQPAANTLGVKILGLAFPVIFIVGILAAIVIPAYNDVFLQAQ
ncbi:MAG: DUF805 domain-containing protein [Pseudomonadota bacterium]